MTKHIEPAKPLKRVKEQFSILDDGRSHNPAPQKFLLSALQRVLRSPETKERVELNEATGFYGHNIRQLTKMRPNETEVIEVKGKPLLVNVVPAVRTVSVDIDDDGLVTHEQEFLDNELGRAALALYEQGTGGFSWAMSGSDGKGAPSITRSFSGFDYVLQPNFLPKNRENMLLSSIDDDGKEKLLSCLVETGLEPDAAEQLLSSLIDDDDQGVDMNELILSHLASERDDAIKQVDEANLADENRKMLLSSVIDNAPFEINADQKQALLGMASKDDAEAATSLFSSLAGERDDAIKKVDEANLADENRTMLLSSVIDNAPFDIDADQKQALLGMASEDDAQTATALFSSIAGERDDAIKQVDLAVKNAENRAMLLSGVVDNSPFLVNEEQKSALINISTEDDVEKVTQLFSSMARTDMSQLPTEQQSKIAIKTTQESQAIPYESFDESDRPTFRQQG